MNFCERAILRIFPVGILCLGMIGGCGAGKAAVAPAAPIRTSEKTLASLPKERLTIQVDPRTELFSILCRLAGFKEYLQAPDNDYVRAVDEYFKPFAGHPAVAAMQEYYRLYGIGYNAPMSMAVQIDQIASAEPLLPMSPLPKGMDKRWEKIPKDWFFGQVRDFVLQSKAEAFLMAHREYYQKLEASARTLSAGFEKNLAWTDSFFGAKTDVKIVISPAPLVGPNNYSSRLMLPEGAMVVYITPGMHQSDPQGLPKIEEGDGERAIALLQHELTHAYANPIVDAHLDLFKSAFSQVYPLVEKDMQRQTYGNWQIVAYETLVRASTILCLQETLGAQAARRNLRHDEKRSFWWMGQVVDELKRYLQEREKYPTLDSFAPRLASAVESWSKLTPEQRALDFGGPINAVFKMAPLLFVAPVVDARQPAAQKAYDSVLATHKEFFSSTPLRAADAILANEADSNGLIVYGTPSSNPLLTKLLVGFDIKVEENRIAIGPQVFEGPNLVLAACKPHPANPKLPVLIYASYKNEDLVNINVMYHGPSDWVVGRKNDKGGFDVVRSGDFE